MKESKAKITEGGRISIPAEYRQALGLRVGDEIIIRLENDELHIFTPLHAIKHAYEAGTLRPSTKKWGIPLGDRACLALAKHLKLPAVTADKTWGKLTLPIDIRIIRQNGS